MQKVNINKSTYGGTKLGKHNVRRQQIILYELITNQCMEVELCKIHGEN